MANYKKWSSAEIAFIRENASGMSDKNIALRMSELSGEKITASMVRQQRRKIKVVKSIGRPRKVKDDGSKGLETRC